ncbi:MAG TPA: hypothetical protein VF823_06775 [Anaerolineales bacterium]
MHRKIFARYIWLAGLALLLACRAFAPALPVSPVHPNSAPVTQQAPPTFSPGSTPTATAQPLSTPSPFPTVATTLSPTVPPLPSATSTPSVSRQTGFTVRLHPDGPLFVGDQVSLEVISPANANLNGRRVQVQVDGTNGKVLGPVDFGAYGLAGRAQATLLWAWDTAGLPAGSHTLAFSIVPGGPVWYETVWLAPQTAAPQSLLQAKWASAESQCCVLYYITGTDAERDLDKLKGMVDEQARDVVQKFGTQIKQKFPITLIPRVLGNGGFTSEEISVSYLDENYANFNPAIVLHHEIVHLVDGRLGGDLRPTLLVEGLAVYLSGGHFKPEPLMPRAAALLPPAPGCVPASLSAGGSAALPQPTSVLTGTAVPLGTQPAAPSSVEACGLDRYLPLAPLFDNFYSSQHEIGYLEAGSLIEFMVNTWGWPAFSSFYRDIHGQPSGRQADAVNAALNAHFGLSLADLEMRFQNALRREQLTSDSVNDVRLTVALFDTVRRYQEILDPSAYFLTAWLPDPVQMRQRGIVADYLRHPAAPENKALEDLLIAAGAALQSAQYGRSDQLLRAINASLDVFSGLDYGTSIAWILPWDQAEVLSIHKPRAGGL